MKVLILSDLLNNWAIHNRAKAIKKFLPDLDITIRAGLANKECLNDHEAFDIVHFNFSYGLTLHYKFIRNNMHRCLITAVNERSWLIGHGVDPDQYKEIMTKCPYRTSVGPLMAELTGCEYIPNGIDEDLFPWPGKLVVGFSGTTREAKNMASIEKACKEIGAELRTSNYNNNNPDLPHEKMHEFYKSLDVYVHASLTEGFNNTILEALACNIPVLMTRQGAWKDFDGWVTFVEPTPEGICAGLRLFTGRQLVDEKFLWKNIVPKYKAIYERIYANHNRILQSTHA